MDYTRHSDGNLLAIFKSGDTQAFNALFNRHWKPLFCLAKKIVEDGDLAQDIVQETFVAFFQNAPERQIQNVKSYLYQTVKYQCFMQLRSGRISKQHLERLEKLYVTNSPEESFEARELEDLLIRKMESLPEKCREVFYLSRYEMLSNKMIAEQLQISQKTVEHQITKALKVLRLSIGKMAAISILVTASKFL